MEDVSCCRWWFLQWWLLEWWLLVVSKDASVSQRMVVWDGVVGRWSPVEESEFFEQMVMLWWLLMLFYWTRCLVVLVVALDQSLDRSERCCHPSGWVNLSPSSFRAYSPRTAFLPSNCFTMFAITSVVAPFVFLQICKSSNFASSPYHSSM